MAVSQADKKASTTTPRPPRRTTRRGPNPKELDDKIAEAKQKSVDEQVKPGAPGEEKPAKRTEKRSVTTGKGAHKNVNANKPSSPTAQPEQPAATPVVQNSASAAPETKRRPGRQPKWQLGEGETMEQVTLRLPSSVMSRLKLEATQLTQANLAEGLTASDATVNHQDVIMQLIRDHLTNHLEA